jgi:hypothetical protein
MNTRDQAPLRQAHGSARTRPLLLSEERLQRRDVFANLRLKGFEFCNRPRFLMVPVAEFSSGMVCADLKSRTLTAICCSSGVVVHEGRFKLGFGAAEFVVKITTSTTGC